MRNTLYLVTFFYYSVFVIPLEHPVCAIRRTWFRLYHSVFIFSWNILSVLYAGPGSVFIIPSLLFCWNILSVWFSPDLVPLLLFCWNNLSMRSTACMVISVVIPFLIILSWLKFWLLYSMKLVEYPWYLRFIQYFSWKYSSDHS